MTKIRFYLLVLLCIVCVSSAFGQQATSAAAAESVEPNTATAMVFNRDVITFRSAFLGNSPEERARRAEERITEQLSSRLNPIISTESNNLGTIFQINGTLSFVLTPSDVDALEGETLEQAKAKTLAKLNNIVKETKESRNTNLLLRALAIVIIATLALGLLIWLLSRAKQWFEMRMLRLAEQRKITVDGVELIKHSYVIGIVRYLVRALFWILIALTLYEWSSIVLHQFPYTRPWGEQLNHFLFQLLSKPLKAIVEYIPSLLTVVVIYLIARFFVRLLSEFFERIHNGSIRVSFLDAELAIPSRKIITAVIWLFALVMAYPYLPGSNSDAFKGVSVLVGLMISLGASNIISQGASGLILTYTRTFRVGEYVRIGDIEGTVTELGMFTTRLRTGLGEEITLSNSTVFSSVSKNYSRTVKGKGFILDTTVTIGYDTPWRQVEAMLLEAAAITDGLASDPPPRVHQTSLSDFYPEYRLICQAIPEKPTPRALILSALHANIQDTFNKYAVQIMSPHYEMDPGKDKIVSADRTYLAPAKPPQS